MRFARLDNGSIVEYPLTIRDLQEQMPEVAWPANPSPAALADKPYVVVEDETKPSLVWGETATEGTPVFDGSVWRQAWIVGSVSLAQAKTLLANLAIEIYWQKMQQVPTIAEMTNEAGSYSSIMTARETRFRPVLIDVRNRIQAATTVAEARSIYLELENTV